MTIEFVNGDLLDGLDNQEVNVIGHVVNCQGVMGSGIAFSIKQRYPMVFERYRGHWDRAEWKAELLGTAQAVYINKRPYRHVFNLFAQFDYGRDKRNLNYGAIAEALQGMAKQTSDDIFKIGFPFKMGSDRAGGDWSIVLEMIEFYFKDHNVKIYKL